MQITGFVAFNHQSARIDIILNEHCEAKRSRLLLYIYIFFHAVIS